MDKFPKFIIEGDNLVLMKATYHRDIATDKTKIKGGGWYRYLQHTDMFVFYGESDDFGAAKLEDIKRCVEDGKVFSDNRLYRNISASHNFGYDTGTQIITLPESTKIEIESAEKMVEYAEKNYVTDILSDREKVLIRATFNRLRKK
jgi:hypothetical protein